MHSVALDEDGCVWSWGVNDEGALGRETAGEVWEKYAGRTGVTGDSYVPGRVAMPAGAGRVVQLSAGDSHTVALTEEGVVYAWGTFRSDAGVMGFNESTRLQLVPVKVRMDIRPAAASCLAAATTRFSQLPKSHVGCRDGTKFAISYLPVQISYHPTMEKSAFRSGGVRD